MLPRLLTALALLLIWLPAIFWAPPWVWGVLSLLAVMVAAWEWERLLVATQRPVCMPLAVGFLGAIWWGMHLFTESAAMMSTATRWAVAVGSLLWAVLALPALMRVRRGRGGRVPAVWWLWAAWVALFELRAWGPGILLSCLALVWFADTGAYFVGRGFGRHLLAPRVSPGKTWEGAVGGWAMACLGAALMGLWGMGLAGISVQSPLGYVGLVGAVTVLVALSIAGDLYESLLKRLAGVKDSGSVLPGHGGVLDRIDALVPTMPVCWLWLDCLVRL